MLPVCCLSTAVWQCSSGSPGPDMLGRPPSTVVCTDASELLVRSHMLVKYGVRRSYEYNSRAISTAQAPANYLARVAK